MNKMFFLLGLAVCTVSPALAISQKDFNDCGQTSDPDRTIPACNRLLASGVLPRKNQAIAYSNLGIAWADKGDYDRAIKQYDESIRIDPNSISYNNRGNAQRFKGEYDSAIADYTEAIRLNPKWAFPYNGRGAAWAAKGDFDKGLADFSIGIRLDPKAAAAYNNRGYYLGEKGDLDAALADYTQAIRLNPKYAKAFANRGDIWRLKGDLDHAVADQEQAVRIDPNDNLTYFSRGTTLRYRGDYNAALADFDHVLRKEPDSIAALTGRGLTLEKMGDLEGARKAFVSVTTSRSQSRDNYNKSALETARARLAALEAEDSQPTIPPAPAKAASATAVPTPAITPSKPVEPKRAQNQGRRVALVIGNSAYQNVPPLTNPLNDASAVAQSLRNIGFDGVTLVNDATRERLIGALRVFANDAENSDWAMVYYAGHGMEVGGVNYLIPVDAKLEVDRDIEYEAVPVSQVLRAEDAAKKIKLVMLDACRDNPFAPRKTDAPAAIAAAESTAGRAIASRSTNGRGLAEVKVSGATLVVFAAKDGQVALDGEGGNSPFAVAVVQRIATPGVEINKVFRLVRDDVMEATAGRQEPYTYGSLPGKEDFFFVAK